MKINFTRKTKIILIIVSFLLVLVTLAGYFLLITKNQAFLNFLGRFGEKLPFINLERPKSELFPCQLDGSLTEKEKANRHPIAVVIENHPSSRPQSGLDKADIVYEALAEGGITRFLAFYGCKDATEIGPVRSARAYFLNWLSPYNALYSHCGGSPEALRLIRQYGILDLNQFWYGKYYWRDRTRLSPHNLYSSSFKLWELAEIKGWNEQVSFKSYSFKDDLEMENRPKNFEVTIYYNKRFVTKYKYNAEKNIYLRFQTGVPHKDRITKEQLWAKNVAVIWVSTWKKDASRLGMKTEGSGKAQIFIDGKVISGTWKKESRKSTLRFFDSKGKEVQFNRGPIWIQVVPIGTKVSY